MRRTTPSAGRPRRRGTSSRAIRPYGRRRHDRRTPREQPHRGQLHRHRLTGTIALGNPRRRRAFTDARATRSVGRPPAGQRDLGQPDDGVESRLPASSSPSNNLIAGNYIGTDATGTMPWATTAASDPERVEQHRRRHGDRGTERHLGQLGAVAANVSIDDAGNNLVAGNFIGTDSTGTQALGKQDRLGSISSTLEQHGRRDDRRRAERHLGQAWPASPIERACRGAATQPDRRELHRHRRHRHPGPGQRHGGITSPTRRTTPSAGPPPAARNVISGNTGDGVTVVGRRHRPPRAT